MTFVVCSKFFFAVATAAIGSGFQHGYHRGITTVPAGVLKKWVKGVQTRRKQGKVPSDQDVSTTFAVMIMTFSIGGVFGGLLTGYFSERWGRKRSLFWSNFIALAAIACLIFCKNADNYELFILGRFLAGLNAGLNAGLCPMYLVEIAPDQIRGAICGLYQLAVIASILLSQIVGAYLGTSDLWPKMFVLALIPSCLQVVALLFCPESPKYLLIDNDDEKEAEKALVWLRGTTEIVKELDDIKQEDNLVKEMHAVTLKRVLTDVRLRTPLILCTIINIGQEMCGLDGVKILSRVSFEDVEVYLPAANLLTMTMTIVNVFVTLIGVLLVDKVGRRLLLLSSFVGMAIDAFVLTPALILAHKERVATVWKYLVVVLTFIFTSTYSIGVGIIPRFIAAEMFNHSTRAVAMSIATGMNWLSIFLSSQAFVPLKNEIGYYVCLVFVVLDFFFFVYTKLFLPETAQLSAMEIMELYSFL